MKIYKEKNLKFFKDANKQKGIFIINTLMKKLILITWKDTTLKVVAQNATHWI